MGASESMLLNKQEQKEQQQQQQHWPIVDEITTVSEKIESVDPILRRIQALKLVI